MSFNFARPVLMVVAVGLFFGACSAATPSLTPSPTHYTTLKDAYAGRFVIGTAFDPGNYSEVEQANIKANYNIVTPENCMKPGPIHPSENTYAWDRPDTLVKWCEDNHMEVWGHNLCWHAQTANWFFKAPDGGQVSRELLIERFKSHVITVVGHYKGRIKGWDVVNEAIADGGNANTATTENLRGAPTGLASSVPNSSPWPSNGPMKPTRRRSCITTITTSESGYKHASSMVLLKRLIAEGAPITGVGIQGHWDSHPDNLPDIERAILDYKSLGLKVSISELDVAITGVNSGGFCLARSAGHGRAGPAPQAATNPGSLATRAGESQTGLQRQATAYAHLFQLFDKYPGTIERITLWGINDRRSWRSSQRPLLFDAQMEPKPAYQAVLDVAAHRGNPAFLATDAGLQEAAPAKSGEGVAPLAMKLPIRIKAGMDEPFKDSQGVLWAADIGFLDGQTMDRTDSLQITSMDRPGALQNGTLFQRSKRRSTISRFPTASVWCGSIFQRGATTATDLRMRAGSPTPSKMAM